MTLGHNHMETVSREEEKKKNRKKERKMEINVFVLFSFFYNFFVPSFCSKDQAIWVAHNFIHLQINL